MEGFDGEISRGRHLRWDGDCLFSLSVRVEKACGVNTLCSTSKDANLSKRSTDHVDVDRRDRSGKLSATVLDHRARLFGRGM